MPPQTRSDAKRRREGSPGKEVGPGQRDSEVVGGRKAAKTDAPSTKSVYPMSKFPYHLPYARLDLREKPHLYRPGVGEQGVLTVEPYKSELLPLWKFKDPPAATTSSSLLRKRFDRYVEEGDFAGADMARKFVQMGFTRSRRYANHPGGRKYSGGKGGKELPRGKVEDKVKAESAEIFKRVLDDIKADSRYHSLRLQFERRWKDVEIGEEG